MTPAADPGDFNWHTWATGSPERLTRVCEHLVRMRQPSGVEDEVNTMMLAVHLLSWEQRTGQRFPTVPPVEVAS